MGGKGSRPCAVEYGKMRSETDRRRCHVLDEDAHATDVVVWRVLLQFGAFGTGGIHFDRDAFGGGAREFHLLHHFVLGVVPKHTFDLIVRAIIVAYADRFRGAGGVAFIVHDRFYGLGGSAVPRY